jgi:hypothetical protein
MEMFPMKKKIVWIVCISLVVSLLSFPPVITQAKNASPDAKHIGPDAKHIGPDIRFR